MNPNKSRTGIEGTGALPGDAPLAADTMRAVVEVAEEAKDLARQAHATMSAPADSVAEHSRSIIAQGVDMAGEVAALAGEIGKASEALDSSDQAVLAGYAQDIVPGLETLSSALEKRGAHALTDRLRQFARTQPAAFLGAAVLAGLAAGRRARVTTRRTVAVAGPSAGPSPADDGEEVEQFEQGLGSSGDAAADRPHGAHPPIEGGH